MLLRVCSVQRLYEQECTAVVRAGHTGTEQCVSGRRVSELTCRRAEQLNE